MNANNVQIIVLDFGSQYTQLIARRLREYGVYTEIVPYFEDIESLKSKKPHGIILSGGPASIYEKDAYKPDCRIFDLGIPILGICYGMQYIADFFGGKVIKADAQEFGKAVLEILDSKPILSFDTFNHKKFPKMLDALTDLWEDSVSASHHFLSKEDIAEIKMDVREALQHSQNIITAKNEEDFLGFIGVEQNRIEMLFVSPKHFKKSVGKELIREAFKRYLQDYQEITLDCNEQNLHALEFYQHLGFKVTGKSPKDSAGRDFPVVHLSISKDSLKHAFNKEQLRYSIAPASEQDLEAILALQHSAFVDEAKRIGKMDIEPMVQNLKSICAEFKQNLILKCTLENGKIVASVRGYKEKDTTYICKLFVDSAFRKKGIASALIRALCAALPAKRYDIFTSEKSIENIALYQRLGFVEYKRDFITGFPIKAVFLEKYATESTQISIKSERTILRSYTQADFNELHKILSDEKTMFAWGHGFEPQETQEWLDKQLANYQNNGFGICAIIEKQSGKIIGNAGLDYTTICLDKNKPEESKKVVEIGYILHRNFWGKGYAIECARACAKYAFETLMLKEIFCLIKDDNFASQKVAQKLGMSKIGESIKPYKGKEINHYVFRLEKSIWQNLSNKKAQQINQDNESNSALFRGVKQNSIVWMSHADKVERIPQGFIELAKSGNTHYCAIADSKRHIYALQFHPEVAHSDFGGQILQNFAINICRSATDWNMRNFAESEITKIREITKNGKVLCAVSGGVDSSVVAALLYRSIGENLIPVFVDTGLLRKGEREAVEEMFRENLGVPLITADASTLFLERLKGVIDPEKKRKIIGETFIEVFEKEAKKYNQNGEIKFLAQGTLYPDVIESVSVKGPSKTIKSHHNVGGLPEWMKFELIEPLRELFKDEVRALGRELGMPKSMLMRHPFPGPGLAIRIMGEVNKADLDLLREADFIFVEELHKQGYYDKVWQAFCVLLNVRSVGVMGDNRTYDNTICVRAVEALDGMTATFAHLPHDFLESVSNRIINEVEGVNRVVYDITSKPPGTIEWE